MLSNPFMIIREQVDGVWVENTETGERVPLTAENMPKPIRYTFTDSAGHSTSIEACDPLFRVLVEPAGFWRWLRWFLFTWRVK